MASLASDDAGTPVVQSPSAVEADFVEAQDAEWDVEGPEKASWYGYSVASAGNVDGNGGDDILVGAPKDPTIGEGGAAYLYLSTGGGLDELTHDWSATAGEHGALFGRAVAGAGDVNGDGYDDIIIGAPEHKNELLVNGAPMEVPAGRALVYMGVDGQPPSVEPTWSYTGTVKAGEFAYSVAGAGDLNDDGYDDIVVGARSYTDLEGEEDAEGAVYVFFGSPSGLNKDPGWLIDSDQARAWLGAAVSGAGDVNGDGYDDLLVGAPKYVNPETGAQEGAVFLFLGRATGAPAPDNVADASWRAYGGQAESYFGTAVADAGDVNDDGYADVVVSTPWYHRPDGMEAGAAFAYCGSATGFASTPCWKVYGAQSGAQFGASAAGAGDVNDDGYDEVIVGAPAYEPDPTAGKEGAVFVYFGSDGGLMPWAGWKAGADRTTNATLGASVASAGDVDGDGVDGILFGSYRYFVSSDPFGAAFCFYGPLYPGELYRTNLPLVMRNAD